MTRIISKEDAAKLIETATGYKIFNNDWTAQNGYSYLVDGKVEGTTHVTEGELAPCKNGLHFCKNPLDCLKFYPMVQWNKFAKVTALGETIDGGDGKTVAEALRIDEVLTWDKFLQEIRKYNSYGVSYSEGVSDSKGVSYSEGVSYSKGVSYGYGVSDSYGVSYSEGVSDSKGVSYGYGVSYSKGVSYGYGVSDSYGVRECKGVSTSMFCHECEGLSRSIFAYKQSGKLLVFNKKVTEDRFNEIWNTIKHLMHKWSPDFTNATSLYKLNGERWEKTPANKIVARCATEAYADMPEELIAYIKALPEYDDGIFRRITGIED